MSTFAEQDKDYYNDKYKIVLRYELPYLKAIVIEADY